MVNNGHISVVKLVVLSMSYQWFNSGYIGSIVVIQWLIMVGICPWVIANPRLMERSTSQRLRLINTLPGTACSCACRQGPQGLYFLCSAHPNYKKLQQLCGSQGAEKKHNGIFAHYHVAPFLILFLSIHKACCVCHISIDILSKRPGCALFVVTDHFDLVVILDTDIVDTMTVYCC